MADLEKTIQGLECCSKGADREPTWNNLTARNCGECPYNKPGIACTRALSYDALSQLKAQGEVIDALLKVGYPHNFQREPRWIVNYMYAITDVVKKAVNLRNEVPTISEEKV